MDTTQKDETQNILDPVKWGLPLDAIKQLGKRLKNFWERFNCFFKTRTCDNSHYGYHYLSSLLRMRNKRNYTTIGKESGVNKQNVQHFMSNSPWDSQGVYTQIQREIKETPALSQGGVLLLDESADAKSGKKSAGTGRQYNGRLGKIDMSQVGVFLAYVNLTSHPLWTWVTGDLFLPKHWFSDEMEPERKRLGIPEEIDFRTKIKIGLDLIKTVKDNDLPFEIICFDDLYGRSEWLRGQLREDKLLYMADIPFTTYVYLKKPELGVPEKESGKRGKEPTKVKVLSCEKPQMVSLLAHCNDTQWSELRIRTTERGELRDLFAVRRVWTIYEDKAVEELLVIRKEKNGKCNYSLCNAPLDTPLPQLAWWKCQRYFIERANQEAKSEIGWDEFQAQKYRGWQHHLALTILASWFIAQTRYEWSQMYERDPDLARQFDIDILPMLSVANVRSLLRTVMPLSELTTEQAVDEIIEHLINRTRSRKSRMKKLSKAEEST